MPSEETNSAISEVDNNTVNEVNSVQEKEDSAELLDGENSVKESMHATEESSERRDGPVIIFPDDLKFKSTVTTSRYLSELVMVKD